MDANFLQQRMQEIQKNQDFANAYSKIVSGGRYGYKAVIETKPIVHKCKNCQSVVDPKLQKFCHECGTKIEMN